MATNPYSYGSLGQRWTVGEPTSKSLLDVSRVKADANRWALEQLIVDPDDTANFVLTAPGLNIDSNTLYVDSANNSVGFGLTNPNDYAFNGTPSWVASGGAGNASVIVVSGTTSIGYFAFADGTTGTDRYSGNIQYNHSTNTMSFRTNGGVEAMSIDSAQDVSLPAGYLKVSGNPSAGTISSNGNGQIGGLTGNGLYMYGKGSTYDLALANANTSVALAIPTGGSSTPDVYIPNSLGIGTSSPTHTLSLSTTGTDGIKLGVDSQTYYHIVRPNGDGLYLGADDGNTGGSGADIRFAVKGTEIARMLDTGGITFNGDTATANALDDYEEGTYSVTDQSGAGLSFSVTSNRYVKIGKLVWVSIELTYPTTTSTAGVRISLPFTNSTAQRTTMACVTNRSDVSVSGYVSNLPTAIGIIESAASPVTVTNASLSGKYVIIGGVYEVA